MAALDASTPCTFRHRPLATKHARKSPPPQPTSSTSDPGGTNEMQRAMGAIRCRWCCRRRASSGPSTNSRRAMDAMSDSARIGALKLPVEAAVLASVMDGQYRQGAAAISTEIQSIAALAFVRNPRQSDDPLQTDALGGELRELSNAPLPTRVHHPHPPWWRAS